MGHAFLHGNGGEGKKLPVLNSSYPQNATVTAGDSVTFAVLIAEDGKPAAYTYQWYVNGSAVSGAKSQNYTRNTSNDSGVLTVYCEVTNKAGTVTSRTASMQIYHRLTVNSNANASITATSGSKTVSGTCDTSGSATLALTDGTWTVKATSGGVSKSTSVTVNSHKSITLIANQVPAFTYTGSYKIVNDADDEITASADNWKIRLLTSGTLTFSTLNGAADGIDVFCVGGGGAGTNYEGANEGEGGAGGGGGGYTKTQKGVSVKTGATYAVQVGGGGSMSGGGTTNAFGVSAGGGGIGLNQNGGAGGSGGGGGKSAGGSDGGNGGSYYYGSFQYIGGKGQGSTTREFGESTSTLYAGGGGGNEGAGGAGGGGTNGAGVVNTGGGGGGRLNAGGSGIVIIRNKR